MPILTEEQEDALERREAMRRIFIRCEALDPETGDPSPAGFWDDIGVVSVSGKDYHGSGNVVQVANIPAKSNLSISPVSVTVSGLKPEVAALVRGSTVAQRPVTISFGIFDTATRALIGPLVRMFSGFVDDPEIKTPESGGVSTIALTCESIARELTIRSTDTRSHESQQRRSSGDDFFKYTEGVREQAIYFGRKGPRGPKSKR